MPDLFESLHNYVNTASSEPPPLEHVQATARRVRRRRMVPGIAVTAITTAVVLLIATLAGNSPSSTRPAGQRPSPSTGVKGSIGTAKPHKCTPASCAAPSTTTTLPPASACKKGAVGASLKVSYDSSTRPICLFVGARYTMKLSWVDSGWTWGGPEPEAGPLRIIHQAAVTRTGTTVTFAAASPGIAHVYFLDSPPAGTYPADGEWQQEVEVVRTAAAATAAREAAAAAGR